MFPTEQSQKKPFWFKIICAVSAITMITALCAGCSSQTDTTNSEAKRYTVTFTDWDGTVLKTEKVESGKAATPPDAPHREGYVFVDWNVDFQNVTSDLLVTATYSTITAPTVSVDSVQVDKTSETVDVAIRVLNNPGISSLKFSVEYASVLTLEDVKLSSAFGPYLTTPTPYSNPQMITLISPMEATDANGVLATLTFSFSAEITAETADVRIVLSKKEVFDEEFNIVEFEHLDGIISFVTG